MCIILKYKIIFDWFISSACLGYCAAQYAGGAAQQTGDTSSWHTGGITCLLLLLHHADHTGVTGDTGDSGDSRLDRAASF